VQGPVKKMTAQWQLDGQERKTNMCSNNITTDMTVKISAPFRLDADQRKVFVDSTFVNIASPVGRQDGDYLYSASVTILRENNAVYTTAPMWASVEVEWENAARSGRRDA
jgi:hypothetical protein